MVSLRLLGITFLCGLPLAAQNCPAVNFRNDSQQIVYQNGAVSALARMANGSFTLHSYSYTPYDTPGSIQVGAPLTNYQQNFFACTGRSPAAVVPPANWSFLGASLLGTVARNPAAGNMLNNVATPAGLCLQMCNSNQAVLEMAVAAPGGNIASEQAYTVGQDVYSYVVADLNNDGLADVVALNSDFPTSLSVYLMQANGTLGAPTSVSVPAGFAAVTAADFNGDGNIDLAVSSGATASGTGIITMLLGNGNGTFRSPIMVNTGATPELLVAADVNGDSKLDLVESTVGAIYVQFGNGDGTFQLPQTITTPGLYLFGLAAADLNHDGKPDIVASDATNGVVLVLLNAGNGTFPAVSGYTVGFPEDIGQFFLTDFDWDGNTDIVFGAGHPDALSSQAYSTTITVLFGNGDGTFYGVPAYPIPSVGNAPEGGGIAIADFNGDGIPDAVAGSNPIASSDAGGITALIGNGNGTFTPRNVTSQQGSNSLAAGDFNRDGKMDFLATHAAGISVFLGNGDGSFQQPALISTASDGVTGAAVGDFNGDGKPDFAVVDSAGGTSATALVYLGNGDGTFQAPLTFTVGSSPMYAQAIDVNGDGKLDLVVTDYGTGGSTTDLGGVAVLLGNGDGTFQPAVQYPAGDDPSFTLVTDINGDGKPDLISSTITDPNNVIFGLIVRLNQGGGAFGAAQTISASFGPTEIGAGDLNGDGKVDLLVGHCCGDTQMSYFLGNGDGTFQPEVLLPNNEGQVNLRVADLNGDGKPDAMFTMDGAYAAAMINISAAATPVTIQTSPAGLQFSLDGTAYTAPQTLSLAQGTHTIAVASPQPGATGTEYVFSSWSDGGAASHTITVGTTAAAYTATFSPRYQLTVSASPAVGGTVSPATGFYNSGTVVNLSATANSGYTFSGWTGSVANASSASTTVTMSAPETVTANFTALGPMFMLNPASANFSVSAGAGTVTVTAPNSTATWTAVSNSSFLTIASSASGTGNGTVSYSVAANTTGSVRTGTLTIAGLTFTVNQSALNTAGLGFYPVTPCRVADTRTGQGFTGQFGPPSMTAGQIRTFTIPASSCNIPATAQAYSLNVTVVPATTLSYLTIWPTGQTQPYVSTLNSQNGAILANAAIVPAGSGGSVTVYVTDATNVIIDINGYFAPPGGSALAFYPVTPCRIADTRNANGPFGGPSLAAGTSRSFTVPQSSCGIPTTAQAYSLNMTVVPPGPLEYLTVWPSGQTQPNVSTLNALQGQVAANAALVPAGSNGAVSVFVSNASNVILDINGYFAPPGGSGALYFYPLTPCRIADTRNPTGTFGGPSLGDGATRTFPIQTSSCGLPPASQAYSLNMTVVPPGSLLFLTTWPAGQTQPGVSTLNDLQGQIVANAAIVPAGAPSGGISVYVSNATNVIIDVNGYFGQ